MLFEITRSLGELELEERNFSIDEDLKSQFLENPLFLHNFDASFKEVIPVKFELDEDGILRFEEFGTPIENLTNDLKEKVFYRKGREKGGDYTFASNFYVNKGLSSRNAKEALQKSFFDRFLGTKIIDSGSQRLNDLHSELFETDEDYQYIFFPLHMFVSFYSLQNKVQKSSVEKCKKDIVDFLFDFDYKRAKLEQSSYIELEVYEELLNKPVKEVREFKNNISEGEAYAFYNVRFNVHDLIEDYNGLYFETLSERDKTYLEKKRMMVAVVDDTIVNSLECLSKLVITSIEDIYALNGSGLSCCSHCLEEKIVYGNVVPNLKAPYNQFSVFKDIYASNGANKEVFWSNFPTCFDCGIKLEVGARIAKKAPYRTFWNNMGMYILPYSKDKETFKEAVRLFNEHLTKFTYDPKDELLSLANVVRNLQERGSLNLFNMVIDGEEVIAAETDFTLYVLLAEEIQDSTSIRKSIETISKNSLLGFENTLKEVRENDFFKYYIDSQGDLVARDDFKYYAYTFINHLLKDLNRFNLNPNLKEYNQKNYYDMVVRLYSGTSLNMKFFVRKFNELMQYTLRNSKEGSHEFSFEASNEFNRLMFAYYVFLKTQKEGVVPSLKPVYKVIYSTEERNFKEKMLEMASDALIETNLEKAAFLLGFLTKRIVSAQKENHLQGKFVQNLYRPITNMRQLVRLFNQISEMINSKYNEKLGYLQPILEEVSSLMLETSIKVDKDLVTFRLLQGYQLESRVRKFIKPEEEIEKNKETVETTVEEVK